MLPVAVQTMNEMPEVYDVFKNNCQHFTLRLLDKVLRDGRKRAKVLDGTYRIAPAPKFEVPMTAVVTRIDADADSENHEEVEEEKQPVVLQQIRVVAPKLDAFREEEEERLEVVPTDPQAHFDTLKAAVELMTKETPSIKESAAARGEQTAVEQAVAEQTAVA